MYMYKHMKSLTDMVGLRIKPVQQHVTGLVDGFLVETMLQRIIIFVY